ncbi:VWA domain-containing protein [Paucibacter soli]|uniref:VWA domain-containing protein n=1 Tax=Paucibacter soli TaxID=3133433 RepID=UPI0030AD8FF4
MAAASQTKQTTQPPHGVTRHANDKGVEVALGIGKGNKRLNTHAHDLQEQIEVVRDDFLEMRSLYIGRERHDIMRNGLLGEVVSRTPIFIYDLPELKAKVSTAFVDMSGKMYIADTFARKLISEHSAGLDSLNVLIRHEADHLRRMHLARMLDLRPDIANAAQDIRINIDIVKGEAADRFADRHGRSASDSELLEAVKAYLLELAPTAVGTGWAMNFEDYQKYGNKSEEAIAAILMTEWKDPPAIPNREVSFNDIMEGAAQEADHVKVQLQNGVKLPPTAPPYAMTPAALSGLANDLRRVGKAKANPKQVSNQELQDCLDRLNKLKEHQGLLELDTQHIRGAMAVAGKGATFTSGKTGDAYLDALKPSERVDMAVQVLDKILNPQNSANNMPSQPQSGVMTIKDLERAMGRGQGSGPMGPPQQGQPQPGEPGSPDGDQSRGDPDTIPAPNVLHGQDHVMDTQDLVDLLKGAGVSSETLDKLGYADLDQMNEEIEAAKNGVVSAINKASEDQMRVGDRYPGGHLLNYAKAQMLDFFKPVLTWQMVRKKILEQLGKGQRHDPTEPWVIYSVDAADMGFKNQRDVPFMGSLVPGKLQRPLAIDIYDTSGSVDDAMLKRFFTEGINMSRKISRGTAPDVIHVAADTIARGEPIYITEKNYKQVLKTGVNYGGRGGTNFQASLESAFHLVKPGGKKTPYSGRTVDAIFYYTDTGDSVPDFKRLLKVAQECGMKKLPTTVFIAPKTCYNDSFRKGIEGFASIVYFESGPKATNKTHIDVDKLAREQEAKQAGLTPATHSRANRP